MVEQHHIRVERTLRYFSAGSPHAKQRLIVLHGYSQHPKFFLRKMESLAGNDLQMVAPEGPHRFYVKGHSGRVGASWMTKEDRESDIADNHAYLEQLLHGYAASRLPSGAADATVLLGFSQGAATAVRFFCATDQKINRLILWAGSFPPDLSLPHNREKLNVEGIDLVVGDADEFILSEHIVELQALFDREGIRYRLHRFPGGHDIDVSLLERLLKQV